MNTIDTYLAAFSLAGAFIASVAVAVAETEPPKLMLGQAETQMRCLICHGDQQTGQQRLAPPMMMVKRHYQSLDQDDFEKAILDWVEKPDAKKSKMPGAIRRFNLMPAFSIPDAELKLIAQYIHQTDFSLPGNCSSESGSDENTKVNKGCDNEKCADQGCDDKECRATQGAEKGKTKADPPKASPSPEEGC